MLNHLFHSTHSMLVLFSLVMLKMALAVVGAAWKLNKLVKIHRICNSLWKFKVVSFCKGQKSIGTVVVLVKHQEYDYYRKSIMDTIIWLYYSNADYVFCSSTDVERMGLELSPCLKPELKPYEIPESIASDVFSRVEMFLSWLRPVYGLFIQGKQSSNHIVHSFIVLSFIACVMWACAWLQFAVKYYWLWVYKNIISIRA